MRRITFLFLSLLLVSFSTTVFSQRIMEKLDRGLVAVRTSPTQVFLSWRVLGSDPDNVAFNLYRDGVKINDTPITSSSNYNDNNASSATSYTVKTVINGVETGEQNTDSVWATNYLNVPLDVPAPMTMPDGSTCTYSPNDCSVGDVDGDGQYEIIVKWDPSNSKDNSQSGYTGDVYLDCYKLNGKKLWRIDLGKNIRAGAHYTQFQVADYDGDGKAEVVCKTAPGTIDGLGHYLSKGPAATDNDAADYRTQYGYILSGPEYLTVFSGLTGEELATANFIPQRGSVSSWGDSYGNRVDRFLACTAYLDGVHPSIVMGRGYYTRMVVAAWDFRNGNLTSRWVYDSNSPKGALAYFAGNHNLSVGDVDDDGKDEIVYGACAFDDDGTCMYNTGLMHGDAMHLSDLDPDRKGYEVWEVHEETNSKYGEELHDARTGQVFWGNFTGNDNGRGLAANIIPGNRGFEMWSAHVPGIKDKNGNVISNVGVSMNFRIYWDGDLQDELLDGTSVTKYYAGGCGTYFTATGCSSNNGTKATPCLSADILGDWREEVIFRTSDNKNLRIYTTTIPTQHKLYTLMDDAMYRDAIAWQNTGYNQPPHAGFYIGNDMNTPPPSAAYDNELRWNNGTNWDDNSSVSWTDSTGNTSVFTNGQKVLFDITAGADANVNVIGNLSPKRVKVNSPYNVTISGTGTLNGSMDLRKTGKGSLTLNNDNNFTGNTTVWDGNFFNNGMLPNSEVSIQPFVTLGGKGTFGKDVTLYQHTAISPGAEGETGKMTIDGNLTEDGDVTYHIDVKINNDKVESYDTVQIKGDWNMNSGSSFILNTINGTLQPGDYVLVQCDGTVSGDITKIKISGIPSYLSYSFVQEGSNIILRVNTPSYLTWKGDKDADWDNGKTSNWILNNDSTTFSSNDSVLFNDDAATKSVVINESVSPGSMLIEANSNFSFSGSGSIDGTGRLVKNGTGKATLSTTNSYTGKTIINDGTLEISSLGNGGVASGIGAATSDPSNIQLNGGTLSITGATQSTNRGMTLGENGGKISVTNSSTTLTENGVITGTGDLVKQGSGNLVLSAINTYTGKTVINLGSITLPSDLANVYALSSTDTIVMNGGGLIMFNSPSTSNVTNWNLNVPEGRTGFFKVDGNSILTGSITGDGMLNYFSGDIRTVLASDLSTFGGTVHVMTDADGGNFILYNSKGYANTKINLNNNVNMIYRATDNITIPVGDLTGAVNAVLGAGGTGPCTINWEIGQRNENSTFNGKITDMQYSGSGAKAAITKLGTGTWTLTNSNTFSGGTTIYGGAIMVNNTSGSGLGSAETDVFAGGELEGSGSIDGLLGVFEQGTLSPGNGVGTFTVNNDVSIAQNGILNIDIDKTNSKNDELVSTGTVDMQGTLQINALNGTTFSVGDSFKVIDGTVTGTPTKISPATPGDGLAWDLSEFDSNGVIKVKVSTAVPQIKIVSRVYPNPVKDNLKIELSQPANQFQVALYNLLGDQLYNSTFNNQSHITIHVGQLPKGIYLLQMNSDSKSYTQKIVKD